MEGQIEVHYTPISHDNSTECSTYRLQIKIRLVLLLVGVKAINGVDVSGVGLIKVWEGHHDGSALRETNQSYFYLKIKTARVKEKR